MNKTPKSLAPDFKGYKEIPLKQNFKTPENYITHEEIDEKYAPEWGKNIPTKVEVTNRDFY
ncbi:MAG: hypothetical protein GY861_18255 [bacterium]|nr:hypothetical protein [bacterium]